MSAVGPVAFVKYHGLGNDYLVVDGRDKAFEPTVAVVRRICDRHLGVGGDGILLRGENPGQGGFALRILNPDGSEAEKSGNGLRIFARALWDGREVGEAPFTVYTPGGEVTCQVGEHGRSVRVDMGRVSFDSALVPLRGERRDVLQETFEIGGEELTYSAATVGNPHCVVFRDPLRAEDVIALGPAIENAPRFPNRTNVQFAKVLDRGALQIEIWERGAGYTLASGSSSCAAAAVAHRLGYCDAEVAVVMPGGTLAVEIHEDWTITQTGPVVRVVEGTIDPEALRDA